MQQLQPASLWRRLAALVYDCFLLFGLLFAATAVLLPFTSGHAIQAGNLWYSAYLLLVCLLFFAWCWTHGGQTLGMRAWRIRLQYPDGQNISWGCAIARFSAAIISCLVLGLGYWSMLFTTDKKTWHDRLTNTIVVHIPKVPATSSGI